MLEEGREGEAASKRSFLHAAITSHNDRFLRYAGIALIYISVAGLAFLFLQYRTLMEPVLMVIDRPNRQISDIVSVMFLPLTFVIASFLSLALGYRLLSAAGVTSDFVLPVQDKELLSKLIEDGNDQGVRLYLDISSIKGTTGTFTKLGITGLPLATIFLTCFFALLGYAATGTANATFLDLAKLTLGAFIGSFVQRQAERGSERRGRAESPGRTAPGTNQPAGTVTGSERPVKD